MTWDVFYWPLSSQYDSRVYSCNSSITEATSQLPIYCCNIEHVRWRLQYYYAPGETIQFSMQISKINSPASLALSTFAKCFFPSMWESRFFFPKTVTWQSSHLKFKTPRSSQEVYKGQTWKSRSTEPLVSNLLGHWTIGLKQWVCYFIVCKFSSTLPDHHPLLRISGSISCPWIDCRGLDFAIVVSSERMIRSECHLAEWVLRYFYKYSSLLLRPYYWIAK